MLFLTCQLVPEGVIIGLGEDNMLGNDWEKPLTIATFFEEKS